MDLALLYAERLARTTFASPNTVSTTVNLIQLDPNPYRRAHIAAPPNAPALTTCHSMLLLLHYGVCNVPELMHSFYVLYPVADGLALVDRDASSLVNQPLVVAEQAGRQQSTCVQVQA
jgi:hypothetical protein